MKNAWSKGKEAWQSGLLSGPVEYFKKQRANYTKFEFQSKELLFVSIMDIIDPWCEANCRGHFAIFANIQYFEYEEDKAAFILRWL